LDKLLEDVQNGLFPITAYHLLFPTHSTLSLLTKSSISEKILTTSSSFSSLPSSNQPDNDGQTNWQTNDPLIFHPINDRNSPTITTTSAKTRNGPFSNFERTNSTMYDSEHHTNDSTTTSVINTNSSIVALVNSDETEKRRIIDVQCKIKIKEARSFLVEEYSSIEIFAYLFQFSIFSYL